MYLRDSDTESIGSADLATIVTVERRPSNAVLSRPKLVEKTSLGFEAEGRAYTNRFSPAADSLPLGIPQLLIRQPPPHPSYFLYYRRRAH